MSGDRSVSLTVPAKGEYVLLARLALSAVCRLTALSAEEVADLKLAVTEAAAEVFGEDDGSGSARFEYVLEDERLLLVIHGPGGGSTGEDVELGRAIVAATVDEHEIEPGRATLVKFLRGGRG